MGDTDQGSSGAAQRARPGKLETSTKETSLGESDIGQMPNHPPKRGFFSRFWGAAEVQPEMNAPAPVIEPNTHGMMNLHRMRVEDVAVPKVEITAVPITVSLEGLIETFKESGLTRLPVYENTLDTPVGMAHLKDVALNHGFSGDQNEFDLRKMLRPLLFVPPSMTIGVLLTKMQAERRHMALVIDEYGGVDGLVTIEDLIEQVIGEIEDEHDIEEDQFWSLEKNGSYLALSKSPLDEFEAEIGISLTQHEDVDGEEIETLGGLVFMLAGCVPTRGEVVAHPNGVEFEVIDADPRRIKRLRVRLPKPRKDS